MDQYRFTKKHTQIAKGIAMILMLFDHLYWMEYGEYTAFIKLPNGHDIPWMIGSIGNICVAMFLFLSGYGMYYTQKKKDKFTIKDSLIRIKNIWVQYLLMTAVIIVIDTLFGKIEVSFKKVILNIMALDYSYNLFAWFMITYVVIILVFPFINNIFKKTNIVVECIGIVGIKVAITVINYILQRYVGVNQIIYKVFLEPFTFLPVFLIGYVCAKHFIFENTICALQKVKIINYKLLLCLILFGTVTFMFIETNTLFDNLTGPILCFSFAYILFGTNIGKLIGFIGNHSTNMWLIHYPIMVTLMNKIVYLPKYWFLILIWIIILMLPFCYVSDYVMKAINGIKR